MNDIYSCVLYFSIFEYFSYQSDLQRIYQKRCPVRGTFTSKVRGVLTTEHYSIEELDVPNAELYRRVWDTQDIIIGNPAGFIIITNLVITPNQRRKNCTLIGMV